MKSLLSIFPTIWVFVVYNHLIFVNGKIGHIVVPIDLKCPSSQDYFDHSGLICRRCDSLSKPIKKSLSFHDDDLWLTSKGCKCTISSLQQRNECSKEDMQRGTCNSITCTSSCVDQSKATSTDHSVCLSCKGRNNDSSTNNTSGDFGLIQYDENSGDCSCNNPSPRKAESKSMINYKLVEDYDHETGTPIGKVCVRCPSDTAVITNKLLSFGEVKFMTAGATFYPDEYKCVHCPDPNMYFDTDYQCKCKTGYFIVGEASIATQKCIKQTPTLASDYGKVKFNSFLADDGSSKTVEFLFDSIIFSHYYLQAAADCEYMNGEALDRSLSACQTLANLCVLTHYDDVSIPCRQFQSIIVGNRMTSYRNQDDWKEGMPWLYYNYEVDDIVEDRSIKMNLSLRESEGTVNLMKYRLAKYNMDGILVGMEVLSDQFLFCVDSEETPGLKSGDLGLRFGQGVGFQLNCNLNLLLEKEMFFYDLYLVDENCEFSSDDNHNGECLFPVPVLNRNLLKRGETLPNRNNNFADEMNDIYTRRFFLFDNLAGKKDDGLKVIRYASKIVLQTKIQSQAVGKIYPPKLIVDYVDVEVDTESNEFRSSKIIYKIEYTMVTKQFWTTVEVLCGFVSAITFVLWIFRVYNTYSRLRYQSGEIQDGASIQFITKAVMLASHCFVSVFFPFIFLLCFYWYIFLQLQSSAFLLLPPENNHEYRFYKIFIHCLCWTQTIYICFIVYGQCQNDISFIDWEGTKVNRDRDTSMWRTVMIANEFDRLQHKRKNLIEINLIIVISCLVIRENHERNGQTLQQNLVIKFASNCLFWFLAEACQTLLRFVYERYFSEPKGQRFIDLCTLAKISVLIMDEFHHGYYLHCRSPYESAEYGMENFYDEMRKEGSGLMIDRGLDAPGCPSDSQVFELFASDAFSIQYKKLLITDESVSNEDLSVRKREIQSFLKSFIKQSPSPQQHGLKLIIREQMASDRFLGITPTDNGSHSSECVLQPNTTTWSQDYSFLHTTFLGVEYQLFLHEVLIFNTVDLFMSNSSFLSLMITYLVHGIWTWIRHSFGSKNLSKKSMIDKRFILW